MITLVEEVEVFPERTIFHFNHLVDEKPLVIKGGCKNWNAFSSWSLDHFLSLDTQFDVSVSRYKEFGNQHPKRKVRMPLRDLLLEYQKYQTKKNDSVKDLYLAGWHFDKDLPILTDDVNIPTLFDDNILPYVNDNIIKYDWSSIFIGHEDTETPNHTDSFYVAVYLALIVGRKTIRYVSSEHHNFMRDSVDLFNNSTVNSLHSYGVEIYEAKLEAGDIAFHPSGWWHQVKNHSFNIAISNNYVNKVNYLPFMQQLLAKSVLPIINRLLELDNKYEFTSDYINSPLTSVSYKNLSSSNFINNQNSINEYFLSYVQRFQLVSESLNKIKY